jgi:hypothetical protein
MLGRSAKKDLVEVFSKRKDFLDKNFSLLPGIRDSKSRDRDPENIPNPGLS